MRIIRHYTLLFELSQLFWDFNLQPRGYTHASLTFVLLLLPEKKRFLLTTNVPPLSEKIMRVLGEGQHGAVPSHSM